MFTQKFKLTAKKAHIRRNKIFRECFYVMMKNTRVWIIDITYFRAYRPEYGDACGWKKLITIFEYNMHISLLDWKSEKKKKKKNKSVLNFYELLYKILNDFLACRAKTDYLDAKERLVNVVPLEVLEMLVHPDMLDPREPLVRLAFLVNLDLLDQWAHL